MNDGGPLDQLRDHVDTFDLAKDQRVDLSRELQIICGQDGKQIAFRGRCPKCGTDHWIPASVTPAQLKALQDVGLVPKNNEEAERVTEPTA